MIRLREKIKYFLFVIRNGVEHQNLSLSVYCIGNPYRELVCKILAFKYKVHSFFRLAMKVWIMKTHVFHRGICLSKLSVPTRVNSPSNRGCAYKSSMSMNHQLIFSVKMENLR